MARSDVLVSADWAESNLDAANVVFVEVDEDTSAYEGGHIAGAIKLDWRTDLQDPVKRDFVDAQQFSKLLSDRGIANDDTVVLYGGNNNWFAAYAYWYFKLYGHDKVKLLDGGRKKWELDGRPLSSDAVSRAGHVLHRGPAGQHHPGVPGRGHRRHQRQEPGRRPLARRVLRQNPGARAPAAGTKPAARTRPRRHQRAVEQGRQRGRHLQVRRGVGQVVRRRRPGRHEGNDCLLPNRGTLVAHLVRSAGIAGASERQELRRQLDGIRLPRGCPDRVGKLICALDRSKD